MLTPDEITHYDNLELIATAKEERSWVQGSAFERDRLCLVLERCLAKFPGDVIEIGCLTGGTTRRIAPVAKKYGCVLVCVDPWAPGNFHGNDMESVYRGFMEMIEPFGAEVIREFSQDSKVIESIQKHRYAFAFVDGDHSYEGCLTDLRTVMPVTDGVIAVDDIRNLPDIEPALGQALKEYPEWTVILRTPNLIEAYLQKR